MSNKLYFLGNHVLSIFYIFAGTVVRVRSGDRRRDSVKGLRRKMLWGVMGRRRGEVASGEGGKTETSFILKVGSVSEGVERV